MVDSYRVAFCRNGVTTNQNTQLSMHNRRNERKKVIFTWGPELDHGWEEIFHVFGRWGGVKEHMDSDNERSTKALLYSGAQAGK